MFQIPLRFLKVGPCVAICATKISNMIQASTRSAQRFRRQQKQSGKYVDGCAGKKAKTVIVMDNGDVITSPYSINVLINAIQRSNARSLHRQTYRNPTNPKRNSSQYTNQQSQELDFPIMSAVDAQQYAQEDGFVSQEDWGDAGLQSDTQSSQDTEDEQSFDYWQQQDEQNQWEEKEDEDEV